MTNETHNPRREAAARAGYECFVSGYKRPWDKNPEARKHWRIVAADMLAAADAAAPALPDDLAGLVERLEAAERERDEARECLEDYRADPRIYPTEMKGYADTLREKWKAEMLARVAATARAEAAEKERDELIHDMERLKDSETHFVNECEAATARAEAAEAALRRVRRAIMEAPADVLTDTLWLPDVPVETAVDCIDAHLAGAPAKGEDAPALPDDPLADLVSRFSVALLAKLRESEAKGRHGWGVPDWAAALRERIRKRIRERKGDLRDVATFCAFAWHHGWSLSRPPALPDDLAALPERLRAGASTSPDVSSHLRKYQALCDEAADAIERLVRERDEDAAAFGSEIELLKLRAEAAEGALTRWDQVRTGIRDMNGWPHDWPAHGNAPLAVMAAYTLARRAADEPAPGTDV